MESFYCDVVPRTRSAERGLATGKYLDYIVFLFSSKIITSEFAMGPLPISILMISALTVTGLGEISKLNILGLAPPPIYQLGSSTPHRGE